MSSSATFVAATSGPVLIIGTGLIGTSIGLALSRAGVSVYLQDVSPTSQALARDMGAGQLASEMTEQPELIVVATPPDVVADTVCVALETYPEAIVTDVASVKVPMQLQIVPHAESPRYVGSHPMAGRETSGPAAADADLFAGRAWVVVRHETSSAHAVVTVRHLAHDMGADIAELTAEEHDQAVALVSHVPQLLSSVLAGVLVDAPSQALALAGGGLRDMTRIANSDPRLWTAITAANAAAVRQVLSRIMTECEDLQRGLEVAQSDPVAPGACGALFNALVEGNRGVERIPGKHGGAAVSMTEVGVLVPDKPGELARLFQEVGGAGINIEDVRIEHSAGQRVGLVWLSVYASESGRLSEFLESQHWRVVPA